VAARRSAGALKRRPWQGFGQRWLARRIPASDRVRLDQRRIFILPTRSGVMFGVALLIMLLAAINYQNSLAYALTFLLGAVFVVAILHTYRNLAGLELQAAAPLPVFAGERARLPLKLLGGGRAHQALALGWPAEGQLWAELEADGEALCEPSLATLRRGWLKVPRLRVESRFPLGLLVAWSLVDLRWTVLVYPRPLAGDLPLAMGAAEGDEQGLRVIGRGSEDFQGLRPYQVGDSRQRLDWKAYSRGLGMQVREFAALGGRELLLDPDALDGELEGRLSLLCHWVLALDERGEAFALRVGGRQLGPDSGASHRQACLRELALYGLPAEPPR